MLRFIVPSVLISGLVLASAPGAAADTIQVNSDQDNGTGCTLREAIESFDAGGPPATGCTRNVVAGTNTITFDPALIDPDLGAEIELAELGTELEINSALRIQGPGMDELTIDAEFESKRVFHTNVGGSGDVEISGLTVTGGQPSSFPDTKGGGILNEANTDLTLTGVRVEGNRIDHEGSAPTAVVFASGAGIASQGGLELNDSIVFDNHVTAKNTSVGDGAVARAGGVYGEGETTILRSTISDNSAVASDDNPDFVESTGGIWSNNVLSIRRSTISHNDSDALSPGAGPVEVSFGGILASGPAVMELSTVAGNFSGTVNGVDVGGIGGPIAAAPFVIDASTIARNGPESGAEDGTQLRGEDDGFVLQNTIVSDPRGDQTNCAQGVDSDGHNVDYSPDGASCFTPLGIDLGSNPLLAPASLAAPAGLAANGGPTETIALQPGSPAIDRGIDTLGVGDQRGSTRPVDFPGLANAVGGAGGDIGAFELQAACAGEATPGAGCPSTVPPPTVTGQRAAALKKCKKKRKKLGWSKKRYKKCKRQANRLPV